MRRNHISRASSFCQSVLSIVYDSEPYISTGETEQPHNRNLSPRSCLVLQRNVFILKNTFFAMLILLQISSFERPSFVRVDPRYMNDLTPFTGTPSIRTFAGTLFGLLDITTISVFFGLICMSNFLHLSFTSIRSSRNSLSVLARRTVSSA